jgi:hypothetical protein
MQSSAEPQDETAAAEHRECREKDPDRDRHEQAEVATALGVDDVPDQIPKHAQDGGHADE